MQPEQDQVRHGDRSLAPEDEAPQCQPADEAVHDPDAQRPYRPSDPAEGPDDDDYTER